MELDAARLRVAKDDGLASADLGAAAEVARAGSTRP